MYQFTAQGGERLDAFLADQLGLDRLETRAWILDGRARIEGRKIKPSLRLEAGTLVEVTPPSLRPAQAEAEDLPLEIVYEDDSLVVVNKSAGMPCHPGPGWWHGGIVNALLHHCQGWTGIGGEATPGIVHRLDRDTTGLVIYAKGDASHRSLLEAMRARSIKRRYWALVDEGLPAEGTCSAPLQRDPEDSHRVIVHPDGKHATTHWRTLALFEGKQWLELTLETGRTHQIRVHLAHLGHPVSGDPLYGDGRGEMRLHAWALDFPHPLTGGLLHLRRPADWKI